MTQKPYLNLGSGKMILPAAPASDQWLVDQAIYTFPLWHNVDKVALLGVDECVDLFTYPWPFESNSFDGALLSHIVEHIPHEIKIKHEELRAPYDLWPQTAKDMEFIQDGWYAFFSELTRVLTPGAVAHVLHPYGWSQGAITDPSHTRFITEQTWTHSLAKADVNPSFAYSTGDCNLEVVEPPKMWITSLFTHLLNNPGVPYIQQGGHNWNERIVSALQTQVNVCYAMYVKLGAVK